MLPYERFSFKVNTWNPKISDIPQKFRISVVGLFPPVVVAELFPDQQRDVQIDYQPVTLTLYPKFNVEKDFQSGGIYVTIVTLFLVCVIIPALSGVFLWRRNRRLRMLIQ
jgi:hypothetical protein